MNNDPTTQGASQTSIHDYIVEAVRDEAKQSGDPRLQKVLDEYDALIAAGKKAYIRLNPAKKTISVVEVEQVEVDLSDVGEMPDADGGGVDFVYMDEADPEYDAQTAAA